MLKYLLGLTPPGELPSQPDAAYPPIRTTLMTRMPLAALALACAASSAFAMAYRPGQEGAAVSLS